MPSYALLLPLVVTVLVISASPAAAFGSGQVSEASGLFGRNFLHGDVEGVLTELVKTSAGAGAAGIIGAIFSGAKKSGKKFTKDDVARVYFGNWLRDLSQAVDVAALKLLPAQRIVNVVAVLGFLEFGFATREFEVTPERLGNYLTVEHIDNPTGYPDDKGSDPREVANYPKLRGPLNPRELDIDERTGMKQYIATEGRDFDTSARFIKDNLVRAIELGRSGKHNEHDEWESLRLLGTALHTLEDFAAHSNFIEVALQKLGYDRVFLHVGDRVRIRAPSGREVAPIVTGSFGGADFMHSMLGTADDKLSQSSTHDVSAKFDDNKGKDGGALRTVLKLILNKDDDRDKASAGRNSETRQHPDQQVDRLEELRHRAQEMNPTDVTEDEVHAFLMEVLTVHDDISRTISGIIDRIPGLDELLGEVSNNLSVFVFSTLEPVMSPIFKAVTDTLFEASAAVVDNHDQTIVFNDENASDPTHSMLAKDHFNNILNAPAGRLAQIIVRHTVQQVVEAWDNEGIDPRQVAESAVTVLHHPDFVERPNAVQDEMIRFVDTWINSHGREKDEVLRRLEKEAVLHHRNNTDGISGGNTIAAANANLNKYSAASQGLAGLVKPGGVLVDAPGANVVAGVLGSLSLKDDDKKSQGDGQQQQSYGSNNQQHNQQQSYGNKNQQQHYGQSSSGRNDNDDDNDDDDNSNNRYGQSGGQQTFGRQEQQYEYGQQQYGGGRHEQQQGQYGGDYGGRNDDQYGGGGRRDDEHQESNRFGGGRRHDNEDEGRFGGNFGRQEDEERRQYGQSSFGRDNGNDEEERRGQGYGRPQQQSFGGGGGGGGYAGRNEDDFERRQKYGGGGRQGGYGGAGEERQNQFGRGEEEEEEERRGQFGGEGRGYAGRGRQETVSSFGRDDDEEGSYGRRQGGERGDEQQGYRRNEGRGEYES